MPNFQKKLKEGSSLNLLVLKSKKLWLEAGFEVNFGRLGLVWPGYSKFELSSGLKNWAHSSSN